MPNSKPFLTSPVSPTCRASGFAHLSFHFSFRIRTSPLSPSPRPPPFLTITPHTFPSYALFQLSLPAALSVFSLPLSSPPWALRKRYKSLMLRYHPDKLRGGHGGPLSSLARGREAAVVAEAYEVLTLAKGEGVRDPGLEAVLTMVEASGEGRLR